MSDGKPDMESLLEPIVHSLKALELGINIGLKGEFNLVKIFTLFSVFDKPTRASILNLVSSHGFFGCLKCYISGQTVKY